MATGLSIKEMVEVQTSASNVVELAPALGIDLDGTIDEAPGFFRLLSRHWPGKVYVITYRSDREQAREDVERNRIRYDGLVLVSAFAEKAVKIRELGIAVYFDDQDEVLQQIPEGVTVLKVRNGGNLDFEDRKWLYSWQTGQEI
jgi:uncharacterized HAD superfamily protein